MKKLAPSVRLEFEFDMQFHLLIIYYFFYFNI